MTKADKRESVIMIGSEPLTFERREWMEVKTNTMIVITPKVSERITSQGNEKVEADIDDMRIDEPPSDPHHR